MNKKIFGLLLMVLPFMAMLSSCEDDKEIIFDHELPQFELREDRILIEVITPQGTTVDEKIYIAGAFNGGEEAAVGNPVWQLEKAQGNDVKWAIYLDPATFAEGTSLADGFYFVSKEQGIERTVKNEESIHYDNPSVGTRTNITVDRWKVYFDTPVNPDEIIHDGFVVYVDDQTGWDELALYAWGDAEPFGKWPGMQITGTVTLGGVKYKYFDMGEANEGLNLNLIFNNNGNNSQLPDFNFTVDRDIYLILTLDGVEEVGAPSTVTHDGFAIYIEDRSGWESIGMYGWATDMPELFGAWPGITEPTGTETINGVTYKYFDTGAANEGLGYNIILHANSAPQFDLAYVTLDRHYYFVINGTKGVEVDPENRTGDELGGGGDDPVVPDEPTVDPIDYTIFVDDQTGWDALTLYAWGDAEPFGGWPGATPTVVTIGGKTYKTFAMSGNGENIKLIFNNNDGGTQLSDFNITVDRNYYLQVSASGVTEIDTPQCRIYTDDQTGWDAIALYAWGDAEVFGKWPGAMPAGSETIGGVSYKYFELPADGGGYNLIFNNNNGGVQVEGKTGQYIIANKDYYFQVTNDNCVPVE